MHTVALGWSGVVAEGKPHVHQVIKCQQSDRGFDLSDKLCGWFRLTCHVCFKRSN